MITFDEIKVKTPEREVILDITGEVRNIVRKYNIKEGICKIFVPHTTAGIIINENADPSVIRDISNFLNKLIPRGGRLGYSYRHGEGNSDAHIKCSLTGHSIDVIIHDNRLMLGTWQGIMFAEYDGPRSRRVYVQIQGE
ncbi:MAG: secondary thiamine-phosphate synthase enzyme YjbQ [Promethearchaeota archaeon]